MPKRNIQHLLVPITTIESKIYLIRGRKVMLDRDLAALYGVATKALNQAVKRNGERFPEDFMYELTKDELQRWISQPITNKGVRSRSQIVTLNRGQNIKYLPYAFTEQGVAMLSTVLKSKIAIQVNIQIMRTFTKLKELLITNELIRKKIEELERKHQKHDRQIQSIFEAIKELLEPPPPPKKHPIGFHVN